MATVACNNLAGQLSLSYSQPVLKSAFYPDIYTVKEEIDTNSNHITKKSDIVKQKCTSLHRGTVRFAQLAATDLSTTSDLSNSKDSGIGSSDDNNSQGEGTIARDDDAPVDEAEDDEEHAKFMETAKKYTNVNNVEKMTWKERGERMDNCLGWLREEITKMKKQDQSLMRQFMELRSTIHQLKQSSTQQSLRATYLRNQASCVNLGTSDQSARSNMPHRQSHSHSRSSLHPLAAASQSSTSSNLSSMQFNSRSNLNQAHSRNNLGGNFKTGQSLAHLEDASFDMDSYFGDVDLESDSFYDDDDSDTFIDQPDGVGPISALSEQPYMPQYRTRTVSLVTPHYIGRPGAAGLLARSRYMSFSNAKGRVESERAILE